MTSLALSVAMLMVLLWLHTAIKYVMAKEKLSKVTTIALLLCVIVVIVNLIRVLL